MKKHVGRIARILVIVIILGALIAFGRSVNWRETWAEIQRTSIPILVAAAVVNIASLVLKGLRWWVFLRPIGVRSLSLALRATFAGAGLNNILIAQGGEAARVIFVSRSAHVPSERVLATLALERLFEMVGYVVMLALAVSFLSLPPHVDRMRPFAFIALALIVGLLVYLMRHTGTGNDAAAAPGDGPLARMKAYGHNFLRTLTGISTPGRFAVSLAISVAVWMLQVWTYALTARAAHFNLSLVGTVAALLAVNLGFAIRATPGNVGVFQMMYAVTAAAFGMDKDQATGVAFLIQAQQILPVTLLGLLAAPRLILEKRRKTSRPDNVLPGEPMLETSTRDGQ